MCKLSDFPASTLICVLADMSLDLPSNWPAVFFYPLPAISACSFNKFLFSFTTTPLCIWVLPHTHPFMVCNKLLHTRLCTAHWYIICQHILEKHPHIQAMMTFIELLMFFLFSQPQCQNDLYQNIGLFGQVNVCQSCYFSSQMSADK